MIGLFVLLGCCAEEVQTHSDARSVDGKGTPAGDAVAAAPDAHDVRPVDMPGETLRDSTSADLPAPTDDASPDADPAAGAFRVATLNLHCLEDNPDLRAEGIAQEIAKRDIDAVALQEICETVTRGGTDNMGDKLVAALQAATGQDWQYSFAKTHISWATPTFAGYQEGIGVLARKGTVLSSGEQLLAQAQDFPRKVAWARVSTPRGAFTLYCVHLTFSGDWTERVEQVQSVLALVNTHLGEGLPQIVAGDFNDKDWTGPIQAMEAGPPAFIDSWAAKHPTLPGNSIGCPSPTDRIDYIFVRADALQEFTVVEQLAAQYQGTCLSDHVGLFAALKLR